MLPHWVLRFTAAAAVAVLLVVTRINVVPPFWPHSACKGAVISMDQLRGAGQGVSLSDHRVAAVMNGRDPRNFARLMPADDLSRTAAGQGRIFGGGSVIVVVSYVHGSVDINAGMMGQGRLVDPVEMVVLDASRGREVSSAMLYGPCVSG